MDLAEAAGCPYTPQQIVSKTHNCILKSQSLPDAATREWKRKTATEKHGQTSKSTSLRKLENISRTKE